MNNFYTIYSRKDNSNMRWAVCIADKLPDVLSYFIKNFSTHDMFLEHNNKIVDFTTIIKYPLDKIADIFDVLVDLDLGDFVIDILEDIKKAAESGENYDLHMEASMVQVIAQQYKDCKWIEID